MTAQPIAQSTAPASSQRAFPSAAALAEQNKLVKFVNIYDDGTDLKSFELCDKYSELPLDGLDNLCMAHYAVAPQFSGQPVASVAGSI